VLLQTLCGALVAIGEFNVQLGAQNDVVCQQALRAHTLSTAHHGKIILQIILQHNDALLHALLLRYQAQQRPLLKDTAPAIPARTRSCVGQPCDALVCGRARRLARNPPDVDVSEAFQQPKPVTAVDSVGEARRTVAFMQSKQIARIQL